MKRISPYAPGLILFTIALIIGIYTNQDHGVSWDEHSQREIGTVSYNYIFNDSKDLFVYKDRRYGVGFELPLIFLEKLSGYTDARDIFLIRHLVTHIFFLLAVLSAYILIYRLYKNKLLASIGFIMLLTEPRIYAHSFFNTKDIPFLSALLITLSVCQLAFDKNKTVLYFVLGLLCGYTTSIRIMGIMLAVFSMSLLLVDLIQARNRKRSVLDIAFFLSGFCIMLYTVWPYLWTKPFSNFMEAYSRMSHFSEDGKVFFEGIIQPVKPILAHYISFWFFTTTPLLWLISGLCGMVWIMADLIRRPAAFVTRGRDRHFLLYLAAFVIPILMVIGLRSVIYDDWRHLYFIYPSFVLVAIYCINKVVQSKYRLVLLSLIALQVTNVLFFMVRDHPFQQVYFNELVSHKPEYLRNNYDFDYWGASFKQALDDLVARYPVGQIKVSAEILGFGPLRNNVLMLRESDRNRIMILPVQYADHYITNFRSHPGEYPYTTKEYSVKVLNSTVVCTYSTH